MFKIAFYQMFDNFNVNLRKNMYSMYSYSGIRSIERTLRIWGFHVVVLWSTEKKCTKIRAAREYFSFFNQSYSCFFTLSLP